MEYNLLKIEILKKENYNNKKTFNFLKISIGNNIHSYHIKN